VKQLTIIKGYNKNKIPFSAVVLVPDGDLFYKGENIDLTKYDIIYKTIRHDVDPKLKELILKYTGKFFSKSFDYCIYIN
jgi:hypothetical protein